MTSVISRLLSAACARTVALYWDHGGRCELRAFWQDEPVVWDTQWEELRTVLTTLYQMYPAFDDDPYCGTLSGQRPALTVALHSLPQHLMPLRCVLTRAGYMTMSVSKHWLLGLHSQSRCRVVRDNFRPLGLPNTADRIIDQAVCVQMHSALRGSLHPSQTLVNIFREPIFWRPRRPHFALLFDSAKAFERVNPH